VIAMIIDLISGNNNYGGKSCLWFLATLIGILLILRPPFLFGNYGESHMIGQWGNEG
jgi:hypothetical protein